MLVLSRKPGQQIRIGRDVVITVVRTFDDKVRLGITAPPSVGILRTELEGEGRPPHVPPAGETTFTN